MQGFGLTTPKMLPWALLQVEVTVLPVLLDFSCIDLKNIPVQATELLQLRVIATSVADVPNKLLNWTSLM